MKKAVLCVVLCMAMMAGCAGAPRTWTSVPPAQNVGTPAFDVSVTPMTQDSAAYEMFKLTVTNKTQGDFEIDWNKSRYLYDGKPNGVFVFEGIDPAALKTRSVANDVVPAGGTLTKYIGPHRMVAFTPVKSTRADKPGIDFGPLPEGKNGVRLVVEQNGQSMAKDIEFELKTESILE